MYHSYSHFTFSNNDTFLTTGKYIPTDKKLKSRKGYFLQTSSLGLVINVIKKYTVDEKFEELINVRGSR